VIEISISSELAAEHPRFMAECLQRGLRLDVFDVADARREPQVVGASAATGPKSPAALPPTSSSGSRECVIATDGRPRGRSARRVSPAG
jgi:hypothetical protein